MATKRGIKTPELKPGRNFLPPPPSGEQRCPAFGFYATAPRYGIAEASPGDLLDFFEAMRKRSAMTWAQLHSNHHTKLGIEPIPHSAIRVTLPAHVTADKTIYSLRARSASLQRIIGYRDGNVFVVVWFDCDGSVYDHGP